jgi:hypothetical protein
VYGAQVNAIYEVEQTETFLESSPALFWESISIHIQLVIFINSIHEQSHRLRCLPSALPRFSASQRKLLAQELVLIRRSTSNPANVRKRTYRM